MYMGSGLVIEAPQTGEPVMITPIAGYWQQNTVVIRGLFTPAEEGKPTLGIDRSCRTKHTPSPGQHAANLRGS